MFECDLYENLSSYEKTIFTSTSQNTPFFCLNLVNYDQVYQDILMLTRIDKRVQSGFSPTLSATPFATTFGAFRVPQPF